MNYFTLHFKENKIERLYNEKYWQKQSKLTVVIISIFFLSWVAFILMIIINPPHGINFISIITYICISISILIALILSIKYPKLIDIYASVFMIVFSIGITIMLDVKNLILFF